MSAYNGVNGTTMSEAPLLAEPQGAWAFDGLVVSDWGAVRSTVASARAAQDLAMPGPNVHWGERLVEAVRAGEVAESASTTRSGGCCGSPHGAFGPAAATRTARPGRCAGAAAQGRRRKRCPGTQ